MIFAKDELQYDIFAQILFIQWIFVEPCELADISPALFFSSVVGIVLGPSVYCVPRF